MRNYFAALKNLKRNKIANYSLVAGSSVIFFLFFQVLLSTLLFIVGIEISAFHFVFSVLASAAFLFFMHQKFVGKGFLSPSVLFAGIALLFTVFTTFAGGFYDITIDGQAYHQEAIIQLKEGWNPVKQELIATTNSHDTKNFLWINHYPKAPWIYEAVLYKVTDKIDMSKGYSLFLVFGSFCLAFASILKLKLLSFQKSLSVSLLIALNPISIGQSLSFYIDGQLGSLLISLIAILIMLYRKPSLYISLLLVMLVTLIINIKFTALAYTFVILGSAWLFFIKNKKISLFKTTLLFGASVLFAICFIGYNPYITNTAKKGHPFYPLAGKGSIDIITESTPGNFLGKNRLENLFVSTFSKTENITGAQSKTKWKYPFTMSATEYGNLFLNDNRVGGFGPLFGGAVIVTTLIAIISLFDRQNKHKWKFYLIALFIFISALVNPVTWWARYVSQLWLIPVIFVILGLYSNIKLGKYLARFLMLVMFINIYLVYSNYLDVNVAFRDNLNREFDLMDETKEPVEVYLGDFRSNRIRLENNDINFTEVQTLQELDCAPTEYKVVTHSPTFCPVEN